MKNKQKKRNNKTKRWFNRNQKIFCIITDILMMIFTILTAFLSNQGNNPCLLCLPFVCAIIAFVLTMVILIKQLSDAKEYNAAVLSEKLSEATLIAIKEANANKRRCILQSTYGRVPQWHPINYTKNILVYDVHEHIRLILSGLRKLIIDTTEGITEDQVTVDLVYCYPPKNNNDCNTQLSGQQHSEKHGWRIITSGNHSLGGSMQAYLKNKSSFYHYVDDCGYCFCNDKMDCIEDGHYIISDKDKEQKSKGSIVGLKMELRNDEPEAIFVQAILTITTYGKKLYEKGPIKQLDYEMIFKENVINSYRSFLLSELSQMYIRHAILEGEMCPKTGQLISDTKKHTKSTKNEKHKANSCSVTGKECLFCDSPKCSCRHSNLHQ